MNPNPYIDEDLQALADTARRFAEERVKPGFLERDQTRDLDRVLLREMGELGFICPELPEQHGGLGMGCLAAGVIHEEIARAEVHGLPPQLYPAPPAPDLLASLRVAVTGAPRAGGRLEEPWRPVEGAALAQTDAQSAAEYAALRGGDGGSSSQGPSLRDSDS